jgi:hypothetical protein
MSTAVEWKHMESTLGEIKDSLADIQKRMQGLELREAGCSPLMTSKIEAAFRKLDDHEIRLKAIELSLPDLKNTARLTAWVASLAASAIILYILNSIFKIL